MTNPKHTPAPWRWSSDFKSRAGDAAPSLIGGAGYGILSCDGEDNGPHPDNARLIAAAPEMLEALQCIDELFSDYDNFKDLNCRRIAIKKYKQAIAKARGES